jgi:predicted nucleic acid-binding protein
VATYVADASYWMALSRKRDQHRRAHADARIDVVPFQSELIDSAVQLYRTRHDKSWSPTDCLSFVVTERRQLTEALTTDRHFEQAGMKVMMHEQPALRV